MSLLTSAGTPASRPQHPAAAVAYQISGSDKIQAWIDRTDDSDLVLALLDWLPTLAEDPEGSAEIVRRRSRLPGWVARSRGHQSSSPTP